MSLLAQTVSEGKHIDYIPGADVAAGAIVAIGQLIGVTKLDIPANELGAIHPFHIVRVPKATGGGTAFTMGANVFWKVADSVGSGTAADGKHLGVTVKAASDADTTVDVMIRPAGIGTAAVVAPLAQDISAGHVEAEVQAISTKVDAILTALKNAGLMASA